MSSTVLADFPLIVTWNHCLANILQEDILDNVHNESMEILEPLHKIHTGVIYIVND